MELDKSLAEWRVDVEEDLKLEFVCRICAHIVNRPVLTPCCALKTCRECILEQGR